MYPSGFVISWPKCIAPAASIRESSASHFKPKRPHSTYPHHGVKAPIAHIDINSYDCSILIKVTSAAGKGALGIYWISQSFPAPSCSMIFFFSILTVFCKLLSIDRSMTYAPIISKLVSYMRTCVIKKGEAYRLPAQPATIDVVHGCLLALSVP